MSGGEAWAEWLLAGSADDPLPAGRVFGCEEDSVEERGIVTSRLLGGATVWTRPSKMMESTLWRLLSSERCPRGDGCSLRDGTGGRLCVVTAALHEEVPAG